MATIEKYCPPTVFNPQGYSQGIKVTNAQTILFLAGQVAYDKDGTPKHKGDFKAQARECFECVKRLVEAGFPFAHPHLEEALKDALSRS